MSKVITNKADNQNPFAAIDSLKGLAALAIVAFHVRHFFSNLYSAYLWPAYLYGDVVGNSFFFFASGFFSACFTRKKLIKNEVSFPGYCGKKLDKLYPPLFISTVIILVSEMFSLGKSHFDFYMLFRSLTVLSYGWFDITKIYNGPLWFLSVLLLCNVIFFFVAKMKDDNYYITAFLIFILGYYIQIKGFDFPFLFRKSGMGYYNFFAGVLTYELLKTLTAAGSTYL